MKHLTKVKNALSATLLYSFLDCFFFDDISCDEALRTLQKYSDSLIVLLLLLFIFLKDGSWWR